MMSIGIGVYAIGSKEAVELYRNAFGLELGYHVLNEDGNYFHSELLKDGEPFLAVAEVNNENRPDAMDLSHNNPVELGYTVESKDEFYRIFAVLKEEGRVIIDPCTLPWSPLATVVMDRFGVRWYITLPQHRPVDQESVF
ncbi:MAG: VOC family protein [Firmicutes bacterium]|nr:VOC family protein [Bacillota bacterium]